MTHNREYQIYNHMPKRRPFPPRERVAHTPFAGAVPSPAPLHNEIHLKGDVDGQDRIHSSQHPHGYIEAPLYDIGVLSDRGMLPGLDSIPAAAVLDRLSLLKYRNVRGSHIYVRPSGEHRFTVLDDLNDGVPPF
jgi:RepB DNA-primase from phage plasmid